jgi:putative transposase
VATRGGRCNPVAGVIFHTVHGTPYTADAFRRACRSLHVTQSMGTVDGNYGSAMPESFFSSAKGEVVDGEHFATRAEARREIFTWLDRYNAARLHGSLAYRPPIE